MDQPFMVQADFLFRGSNNDELCFEKGDIITVTQREEGGWWEGTLGEKTGWFPSNYVKEYMVSLPLTEITRPPEEIQEYRSVVFRDLLESEKAHVAEIQGLLENFLEPLQTSQILNADEYAQLMCHFVEVVQLHNELYCDLENCNDRVGKLFLTKASVMKNVHQSYCATHPKAIVILDKFKDDLEKFMQRQGAATPGLLVLTTGLSKPFRRLDKYSAMLQELERHMENSHPDRGDTQRSVAIYKEIAAKCSATRRQKELELQVLTGPVRGWQGQELSSLGDIIHMGSVAVGADHRDRYFVLFPQTLLILSVSQRMSAFVYEGKLPLTGIEINRLEDSDTIKNALEISGPLIEKIVAVCQGPKEANKWAQLLGSKNTLIPNNIKRNVSSGSINISQTPSQMMSTNLNIGKNHAAIRNTQPVQQQSQHKRSLSFNHHFSYNQYCTPNTQMHHQNLQGTTVMAGQNHKLNLEQTSNNIATAGTITPGNRLQKAAVAIDQSARTTSIRADWCITNLQSAPPSRLNLLNQNTNMSPGSGGSSNNLLSYCGSGKVQPTFEEDALVLRVIESYCAAYQNNSRNTVHSALQPWTPCFAIRGGKLKTSKTLSTSNPQLPFLCAVGNSSRNSGGIYNCHGGQNNSSNLNSSYIWREASANNCNVYSASVSSLNTAYRYSLGGMSVAGPKNTSTAYQRSTSEERADQRNYQNNTCNRSKNMSGYDNMFMTPLLPRKMKQTKILKNSYQTHNRQPLPISGDRKSSDNIHLINDQINHQSPFLYDRRLNRSFESPQSFKSSSLLRSTPHLPGVDDCVSTREKRPENNRVHSGGWCCGNFVMKQWRKIHNQY